MKKRSLGLSINLNLTNEMMFPQLYGAQYVHRVLSSVANISFVTSDTYITLYLKLKICWFLNEGCDLLSILHHSTWCHLDFRFKGFTLLEIHISHM